MQKNKTVVIIIGIIALALVATFVVLRMYQAAPNQSESSSVGDAADTMTSIARLMLIPNEKPVIATINEAQKLIASQAFYMGAIDGDKLVMFPNAKKAVIYSPTRNLIVNSGPFVIGSGPQTQ